jgi:hypothetical protein
MFKTNNVLLLTQFFVIYTIIPDRNTNIVRSARNKITNCHFLPEIGICAPEPRPQGNGSTLDVLGNDVGQVSNWIASELGSLGSWGGNAVGSLGNWTGIAIPGLVSSLRK